MERSQTTDLPLRLGTYINCAAIHVSSLQCLVSNFGCADGQRCDVNLMHRTPMLINMCCCQFINNSTVSIECNELGTQTQFHSQIVSND